MAQAWFIVRGLPGTVPVFFQTYYDFTGKSVKRSPDRVGKKDTGCVPVTISIGLVIWYGDDLPPGQLFKKRRPGILSG